MKKPNIIFIFGDQHRKFDLGCYGHPYVATPNLDFLADNGVRFEHCISNSPVCVPARGTLMTGLFANKHKAYMNDMSIDTSCESIADVLNQAGYHTGYIGKWHINGIPREQAIPKERRLGFTEWKVHNCNHNYLNCHYYDEENVKHVVDGYEPVMVGELAQDFINRNSNEEKPWALYLSFATPHDPHWSIDEEHLAPYLESNIPLRRNAKEKILFKEKGALNLNIYFDTEEYRKNARGYYGHISAIDEQIGILIESLREKGELDNTMIMYSSDHGDMLGSQGMLDKQVPYEESVAIPLLAYWKGHIYHGVSDELIGLNDIPVSIAGLVDAKFTNPTDGMDLSELFLNQDAKSYESAYMYEYFPAHNWGDKGGTEWRAIRTKRYTYAVTADDLEWLLFDNEEDPYQMNNLAKNEAYAELRKELWSLLSEHIEKHDELLKGVEFMKKYADVEEFNRSQAFFNKKVFI